MKHYYNPRPNTLPTLKIGLTFWEQLVMYRTRAELTQGGLDDLLGLKKTVENWEMGRRTISPIYLQKLIALYLIRSVFIPGQELKEASQLWIAAQNSKVEGNYFPSFPKYWFKMLLREYRRWRSIKMAVLASPEVSTRIMHVIQNYSPEANNFESSERLLLIITPLANVPIELDQLYNNLELMNFEDEQKSLSEGYKLTPRELEVLKLLVQGLDGKQIALHLNITKSGVIYLRNGLLRKLNVITLKEAVAKAEKLNLIPIVERLHEKQVNLSEKRNYSNSKRRELHISANQVRCLVLYAGGESLESIANRFYAHSFRFARQIFDLFMKLEVTTLNQAVARASELNLIRSPRVLPGLKSTTIDYTVQENIISGRDGAKDWILYSMKKLEVKEGVSEINPKVIEFHIGNNPARLNATSRREAVETAQELSLAGNF